MLNQLNKARAHLQLKISTGKARAYSQKKMLARTVKTNKITHNFPHKSGREICPLCLKSHDEDLIEETQLQGLEP